MSKTLRTSSIRFFASGGAQLSSSFKQFDNIPSSFETYLDSSVPYFCFTPVDEDLVLRLITNLHIKLVLEEKIFQINC